MAKTICVLSPEEVELLNRNVQPNCAHHQHIKRREAMEMSGRGDFRPYFIPVAEWVGPRHVRMLHLKNIRDLSAKVGSYLALRIRQKRDWALAMHAQMRMRREIPPEMENV